MSNCVTGYNSEKWDPVSGMIHPGNGYRAYNPDLKRFNVPDDWSPFGTGGLNPYAYCMGDPVNRADPSGHHSMGGWLGVGAEVALGLLLTPVSGGTSLALALSVASVTAAVASAGLIVAQQFVEASDPKMASWLGWAALGAGAVSAFSSVALCRAIPAAKGLFSRIKGIFDRPSGGTELSRIVWAAEPSGGQPASEMSGLYMRTPERTVSRLMNLAVDAVADNPVLKRAASQMLPPLLAKHVELASGDWLLNLKGPFGRLMNNVPDKAFLARKILRAAQVARGVYGGHAPSEIMNTDVGRRYLLPLLQRDARGALFNTPFVHDMAQELGIYNPGVQLFGNGSSVVRTLRFHHFLYDRVLPPEWRQAILADIESVSTSW